MISATAARLKDIQGRLADEIRALERLVAATDAGVSPLKTPRLVFRLELGKRNHAHDLGLAMPARRTGDRRTQLDPMPNAFMLRERRARKYSAAKARRARLS